MCHGLDRLFPKCIIHLFPCVRLNRSHKQMAKYEYMNQTCRVQIRSGDYFEKVNYNEVEEG